MQYVAFNIIVAVIVLVQFVHAPGYGTPAIPDFLAALTGTSAATYVANKALVSGNPPTISQLSPSATRPGGQVVVYGSNLVAAGDSTAPTVAVNKGPTLPADGPPSAHHATFRVPAATPTGSATVTVRTPAGLVVTTDSLRVNPDALVIAGVNTIQARPGTTLTFAGAGFYNADDVDYRGEVTNPEAIPASILLVAERADAPSHVCPLAPGHTNSDTTLKVGVPANILTVPGEEPGWFKVFGQRAIFGQPGDVPVDPNILINIQH